MHSPSSRPRFFRSFVALAAVAIALLTWNAWHVDGQAEAGPKKGLPKVSEITEEFELVRTTREGESPMYKIWQKKKGAQMIAQLPFNYRKQRFIIVPTVAGGDPQMGVYSMYNAAVGSGSPYVYWKRFDDTMALMEVNLGTRTKGDQQSKDATSRVHTDRVLLTTKVIATGDRGAPVIDLDDLLVKQSGKFFNRFTRGANTKLTTIDSIKTFPNNVEVTLTMPRASGKMATIHYSMVVPPKDKSFKKRIADRRVGFFYTDYTESSKNDGESRTMRYAHRWNLQKADPSLKLSPPKQPIVYHIEHTTPVRYRRWVREGIEAWNRAFEQVGILNAIEVLQQDKTTGAYMDRDPEDSRYSFIRWTNAGMGFAIGPSHVNPETGQIFEADIVMDEGFIAGWARDRLSTDLATTAMRSMDEETVRWLDANPEWDPRYRLADAADKQSFLEYQQLKREGRADGVEAPPTLSPDVWHAPNYGAIANGQSCRCLHELTHSVGDMRLALEAGLVAKKGEGDDDEGDDESLLDGLPESFVGPLLKDVIMHEVGHTMGLMHNWRGSSVYSFGEMNSPEFKGKKTISTTVMDYLPANIVVEEGDVVQGDYMPLDIGPYDMWAIRWGYGNNPKEVLKEASMPEHAFTSDEGRSGPDPRSKVWDLGEYTLDYSKNRMLYVHKVRAKLITDVVKDGEQWSKARSMYGRLLNIQMGACSTATNWIGGAYFQKPVKGDELAEMDPIVPVPVERQREALKFVLENTFRDEAFGLDPEVLSKLGTEQWFDGWSRAQPDMPIHDQIMGIQATAMTLILNPTTLRRVYDNEVRTPADDDALTIPELLTTIRDEVWSGMEMRAQKYTARKPMVSSLRRNLQREHVDRLISLATGLRMPGSAGETLASLARGELREIHGILMKLNGSLDPYTAAHVEDARGRIEEALKASYVRRG